MGVFMDSRLVAWARSVKARNAAARGGGHDLPALWLFTDARRLADPRAAVARLPRGLCGVVLRHDGEGSRAALALGLARICRERRLVLVVGGDWRLAAALHAGLHLRGGRADGPAPRWLRRPTSSAHDAAELRRARRAGARLAFLSPAFATASHEGAAGLGPVRWGRLAGGGRGLTVAALGGIDGGSVRLLPRRFCRAAGAIGALA
jgi:thiamine-phosphate pyrophosphorylase